MRQFLSAKEMKVNKLNNKNANVGEALNIFLDWSLAKLEDVKYLANMKQRIIGKKGNLTATVDKIRNGILINLNVLKYKNKVFKVGL